MDIEDVKKVIKSLTNNPCICGDNAIIVSGGCVILKKEEYERLAEGCGRITEYNNGWIPCSKRLPEESLNSVLGWDEYRQRCCFVQYLDGRWILGNDIDPVNITAWQPIPEQYKTKENEGNEK